MTNATTKLIGRNIGVGRVITGSDMIRDLGLQLVGINLHLDCMGQSRIKLRALSADEEWIVSVWIRTAPP